MTLEEVASDEVASHRQPDWSSYLVQAISSQVDRDLCEFFSQN
jgi:hypothetical protein